MKETTYELGSSSSKRLAIFPAVNKVPGSAEKISCSLTLESAQSMSINGGPEMMTEWCLRQTEYSDRATYAAHP